MTKVLNELKVGMKGVIQELSHENGAHSQLLSLGILPGDEIEIISKAIFGGPISCKHHNNTFFAVRKVYAQEIVVQVVL